MESGTPSKTLPANPCGRSHLANQSQRAAPPSLWAATAGLEAAAEGERAAVTSVRPRPHICPLSGCRNPSPRPSPLKDNEQRVGRPAGSRNSFRSKGRVIKQEGRGIFSELDPKINAELCSPSHPFCLVLGGCEESGEEGGMQQRCLGRLTFPKPGQVLQVPERR